MNNSSAPAGSSACCGSTSCSQRTSDPGLVREEEIDRSYASDSELGNKEESNDKAAGGCCKVEESKQKEDCHAADDDEHPCEEPKPCCGADGSNREGCFVEAENHPLNTDKALKHDNCCEDGSKEPQVCCDLDLLKPQTKNNGACCDGK
ncbi:hypothetical protein MMC07_004437 [Pseudocyphellaria aurata]|nr:hypothetical protein [Pseudocyphellaria aurata]